MQELVINTVGKKDKNKNSINKRQGGQRAKSYWESLILASTDTRSTGGFGSLAGRPPAERAPRRHRIVERRSEKDRLHLIQAMVLL